MSFSQLCPFTSYTNRADAATLLNGDQSCLWSYSATCVNADSVENRIHMTQPVQIKGAGRIALRKNTQQFQFCTNHLQICCHDRLSAAAGTALLRLNPEDRLWCYLSPHYRMFARLTFATGAISGRQACSHCSLDHTTGDAAPTVRVSPQLTEQIS